ncbi:MAG: hypothetical protein MUQ27_10155, partial [Acidimicrobiia bacterium]|nr:hypothetical protein [Acidimicrobiia bacterium]
MSESADVELPATADRGNARGDADPVLTVKKQWWRRAPTWIVIVAILVVGGIAAWILSNNSASKTTDTVAALKFAEVQRTTLEDVTTLDGTLGFVAGEPL